MESLLFGAAGIIFISLSIYFYFSHKIDFYKGIAWPLFSIALLQLAVGINIYLRSPKDIIRVEDIIQNDASKINSAEIPRMNVVVKNFVIVRYTELALIAIGLILIFIFPAESFWKGVGAGLFLQSGLMLIFDYFAEQRAHVYLKELINL